MALNLPALVRPQIPPKVTFGGPQQPPKSLGGQLILSDNVVEALSKRPDLVSAFPFMRLNLSQGPKKQSKPCRCHHRTPEQAEMSSELVRVKQAIIGMTQDQLKQLKNTLAVKEVIAYIKTPNGIQKQVV